MKSKTSPFNLTLFKKNLTRLWPLWGIPSIIAVICVLTLIFRLSRGTYLYDIGKADFCDTFLGMLTALTPIYAFCYALMCAMCVWSYLFTARSVGMMHSLPITRNGLLLTNFTSGMLMTMIPLWLGAILAAIVYGCHGVFDFRAFGTFLIGSLGECFYFFTFATLMAFVTGQLLTMPVLYGIFSFIVPAIELLVNLFIAGFCYGVSSDVFPGSTVCFSPIWYIYQNVKREPVYTVIDNTRILTDGDEIMGFGVIGWYALVAVVLLVAVYFLSKYRKSETAGDAISAPILRPVILYLLTATFAAGSGLVIYELFVDFRDARYNPLGMALCMIVGGTIGYYVCRMFMARTVRVFNRKNLPGCIVMAVCYIVFCVVISLDLFGVTAYVPEIDKIETVSISCRGIDIELEADKDYELIYKVQDIHKLLIDTKGTEYERGEAIGTNQEYVYVYLEYKLQNGVNVSRRYSVCCNTENLANPDSLESVYDAFVSLPEITLKSLYSEDKYVTEAGYVNNLRDSERSLELTATEAQLLREAIYRDVTENGSCVEHLFDNRFVERTYPIYIYIDLYDPNNRGGYSWISYRSIDVDLTESMTNTIDFLVNGGFITEHDLELIGNGEGVRYKQ